MISSKTEANWLCCNTEAWLPTQHAASAAVCAKACPSPLPPPPNNIHLHKTCHVLARSQEGALGAGTATPRTPPLSPLLELLEVYPHTSAFESVYVDEQMVHVLLCVGVLCVAILSPSPLPPSPRGVQQTTDTHAEFVLVCPE